MESQNPPNKDPKTFTENSDEKQEPPRKIEARIWITSTLTYSFFLRTPSGLHIRQDGYDTVEDARRARDILAMRYHLLGDGIWVRPPDHDHAHYSRRGPKPSPDSFLSEATLSGDSKISLRPEMLPELTGRIRENKPGYTYKDKKS